MKICCFILLACASTVALFSQTTVHLRFGKYTGPRSLGWYTHDHNVGLKRFLSAFGMKPNHSDTYCVADAKSGLYLHASVDDEHDKGRVERVFLSSFPNCMHLPVSTVELPVEVWKTPEGIGIGSTEADVLKAYHQPTWKQSGKLRVTVDKIGGLREKDPIRQDLGDERFGYACDLGEKEVCDDLQFFEVGFSNGRVIWLEISDSE